MRAMPLRLVVDGKQDCQHHRGSRREHAGYCGMPPCTSRPRVECRGSPWPSAPAADSLHDLRRYVDCGVMGQTGHEITQDGQAAQLLGELGIRDQSLPRPGVAGRRRAGRPYRHLKTSRRHWSCLYTYGKDWELSQAAIMRPIRLGSRSANLSGLERKYGRQVVPHRRDCEDDREARSGRGADGSEPCPRARQGLR